MRLTVPALLAALLLLLTGCGGDESDDGADPTTTALPPTPTGVAGRCNSDVTGLEELTLEARDGSTVSAATLGTGTTAAVFVHQTNGQGLCGWLPYAEQAAKSGVRVILVDVCGYGSSECTDRFKADVAQQLGLAVDRARKDGATRVTLVGASMGGAMVAGAGQQAGADALVDVSGPFEWIDVPSVTAAARSITVPFLVIASMGDTAIHPAELRRAVQLSPAEQKRFIESPDGHGYDTLLNLDGSPTRAGRAVIDWIRAPS
ncbi:MULTISPECIES: alpha/beta hydrolase [unclassified Nocardioides]|uniref:alpha/beta hydrolase n=1 Tax=unclassified Nocardioides TaxID=2615069 RepID=UPI0006F3E5F2|nr:MULTISPECIES: alpha/beta hydrolase family protein [unclassified Nocardioides]KQY64657.1 hypothetical protein ASD30_07065 [Nocardioides sp. Root140]KRF12560.1 hypothetical protein ASH02_13420 [Nocardioides sp. Soil796]